MKKEIALESEWKESLKEYLKTDTCKELFDYIEQEYTTKEVFPKRKDLFKAFALTPFSKVRVVILGQDPYHNDDQAHGLSFSVPEGIAIPPSLNAIYKEIGNDIGITKDAASGNLESWATQGVLLLNAILTVVAHAPASHQGKGWEAFTNEVIKAISDKHEHVVFMLWGNYAQSKKSCIDVEKHLILEAPHPSPLSAYKGFFGCRHFSQCNAYLQKHGHTAIVW